MEVMSINSCREIDRYTIKEIGIPSLILMENAAKEVVDKIINIRNNFVVF